MEKKADSKVDFIGIGAQKAGTTWLYSRLMELSEFTVSPRKELHYFDRHPSYSSPNVLANDRFLPRLLNPSWIKQVYRVLKNKRTWKEPGRKEWLLKYFCGSISDQWYLSLFENLAGIKGEITPAYSILKDPEIQQMAQLIPDVKLIFLIRNPIERAWSHYRYNQRIGRNSKEKTPQEIIQFIDSEGQHSRSNYPLTLKSYQKHFPKGQLFLGFFDAISTEPKKLLEEIIIFLGGDTKKIGQECKIAARNNVSPAKEMPEEVLQHLKEKYYPIIKELSDEYGGYASVWLKEWYGEEVEVN